MNFLAHFHLADRTDDLLVGSFLGDFCRGAVTRFPPRWQPGIRLHRRIDAFTDAHEAVKRSVERLRSPAKRYSPVVVDVVYDHFLAMTWTSFGSEPLDDATRRYYRVLLDNRASFPEVAARVAGWMTAQDWLGSYRDLEGVRLALSRMSSRLRDGFRLESSLGTIERCYDDLRMDFIPFFQEIRVRAEGWIMEMTDDR